jgi:hypothetical protein
MYKEKFITVVKSNGKILRENKDTVYIPFDTEYSLMFKNLNSVRALINVEIDGKDVVGGGGLVIEPNNSIELERFVDSLNLEKGNKFKFIKKTKEIQEYRGDRIDDGFIRVTIQFEKQKKLNSYSSEDIIFGYYPKKYILDSKKHDYYDNELILSTFNSVGFNNDSNSIFCNLSNNNEFAFINNGEPSDDEGITVKGSISNQKFNFGYIGELEKEKHVMILKLKGFDSKGKEIEKPITVKTKLKCETCGKTSDSSNKFCGNCGTSLI